MVKNKKLYLSDDNYKLAGVCGGLGEFFEIDPTLIRVIWVFMAMITAVVPAIFAYTLAWVIMPERKNFADK